MRARLLIGRALRWYLCRARHPFKNYIVGHYWKWFAKLRVWIPYDDVGVISVCLGDYMDERIFFDGSYEKPLIAWLRRTLGPSDLVWDVGAHVGAISLVAAQRCRKVLAFEPDPRSAARLRMHLRHNNTTNIEAVQVALGERSGDASFSQASVRNTGMSRLAADSADGVGHIFVPVLRADDFVTARPDATPNVIKLDVEGAEAMVLRGASSLLANAALRAIVFEGPCGSHGEPCDDSVLELLRSAGFTVSPLGRSDEYATDGLSNFLAVRACARDHV